MMGTIRVKCCKNISLLLLVVLSIVVIINYPPDLHGLVSNKDFNNVTHLIMRKNSLVERASSIPMLNLPQDVIDKIKKFVFFVGHPRSGHSIIGSFMDAHPHMVIAHEFMLFKQLSIKSLALSSKADLFNSLYSSSVYDSMSGWRNKERDWKNYTLNIESSWQGRYDRYISVIGDKSGGATSAVYIHSPEDFKAHYTHLLKTIGIPVKVIYCVRNPYDIVATSALYKIGRQTRSIAQEKYVSSFKDRMSKLQGKEFMKARFDDERTLEGRIILLENESNAVIEIINLVGPSNVLEIHNMELVSDPKSTLTKICAFLEVDCAADYLQACSAKVFKSVYKSREVVVWTKKLQGMVQKIIETYSFFHRYSFIDDG
jgi:hypothetical protein